MRLVVLCVVAQVGCAAAGSIDHKQSAITGGTEDTGDPGVVMVYAAKGKTSRICTGEVVSPHVVMTAAHCLSPEIIGAGFTFSVFLGNDTHRKSEVTAENFVKVVEKHLHPDFNPSSPYRADIGVVITADPIAVTPLAMNRKSLDDSMIGDTVRLVGYGRADDGSMGTKLETSARLTAFNAHLLVHYEINQNTCDGDSGGPVFMTIDGQEVIAGITSFGAGSCDEDSMCTRVDVYGDFVDPFIAEHDPPLPDLATASPDAGVTPTGGEGMGASSCSFSAAPARTSPWLLCVLMIWAVATSPRKEC